jgi:hypothetical protein
VDSFEQVVGEILWMQGNWVHTSVKVHLTKEEKVLIGRPSSPRWELDLVAFSGRDNVLRVVECKSFLDSHGVMASGFNGNSTTDSGRYKLFNDVALRTVVFNRLRIQLAECGACPPDTKIRLCLAAGKIRERDRAWLRQHFIDQGWELWDESWLREQLGRMSKQGYENQVSAVVAKLLLRGKLD